MPDHPNDPNSPLFSGIKSRQLFLNTSGFCQRYEPAMAMKMMIVATLMKTATVLNRADSLTPMTRMVVTIRIEMNAGRLKTPVACGRLSRLIPAVLIVGKIVAGGVQRP